MPTESIESMLERANDLRQKIMKAQGDDPNDTRRYARYTAAEESAIAAFEGKSGKGYSPSFRAFLKCHNGWLGFWPDWSLVGIPRADNQSSYENIQMNIDMLPDVVGTDEMEMLQVRELTDPDVILLTNHPIIGTDFNGSFLVQDGNRRDAVGEPEVAWVVNLMHVERRWPNIDAFVAHAVRDMEKTLQQVSSS